MCKITIFTPTYNRAYILTTLYQSILRQTFTDFEWIIVDDGSTDNTNELVQSFINENKVQISYFKTQNGGKPHACNFGAKQAKGELFFIVDSDDFLADNALERLWFHYSNVRNDASFAGVCGMRPFENGNNNYEPFTIIDCRPAETEFKYYIGREKAEAYRTKLLVKEPFVTFPSENYAVDYTELNTKYKLRYFNEDIVYGVYQSDGITLNISKLRKDNPLSFMYFYARHTKAPYPWKKRLRPCIEYWLYYNIYGKRWREYNGEFKIKLPFWAYLIYPLVIISGMKLKY